MLCLLLIPFVQVTPAVDSHTTGSICDHLSLIRSRIARPLFGPAGRQAAAAGASRWEQTMSRQNHNPTSRAEIELHARLNYAIKTQGEYLPFCISSKLFGSRAAQAHNPNAIPKQNQGATGAEWRGCSGTNLDCKGIWLIFGRRLGWCLVTPCPRLNLCAAARRFRNGELLPLCCCSSAHAGPRGAIAPASCYSSAAAGPPSENPSAAWHPIG
jgi:hypothetical protein